MTNMSEDNKSKAPEGLKVEEMLKHADAYLDSVVNLANANMGRAIGDRDDHLETIKNVNKLRTQKGSISDAEYISSAFNF